MAQTTYDIMVQFGVNDKRARRGLSNIGRAADRTSSALNRMVGSAAGS